MIFANFSAIITKMSIDISSDDSHTSNDYLSEIVVAGSSSNTVAALAKSSSNNWASIKNHDEEKENLIDLTQGPGVEDKHDDVLVLSGSSTKSMREIRPIDNIVSPRPRANSIHSDSTEELNLNDINTDDLFDQICHSTTKRQKASKPECLNEMFKKTAVEYKGLKSADLLLECSSERQSSSSLESASSGYVSADCRKRKEVGVKRGPKSKSQDAAMKKQKLEEERRAKRLANEMNKVYKPGECMKYMTILANPATLGVWYMADLNREAAAVGARVAPSDNLPGVIVFERTLPTTLDSASTNLQLTKSKERIDQVLFVQTAEEIAPYVLAHTLSNYVSTIKESLESRLTLVVFGTKDYFKTSGRRKGASNNNDGKFNEIDLEMAFTDLLVSAGCDAVVVDSASELAMLVVHTSKAVAEAPHKLAKRANDEQAEFFMRGDNKNCVAVDKDGNGLSRLWQQMIAMLPSSSLEISRAVVAAYPTPLTLYESLQKANAVNKLADVGVDRAGMPGARHRRLGPEFANRLATLFTARDGDMLVE